MRRAFVLRPQPVCICIINNLNAESGGLGKKRIIAGADLKTYTVHINE